MRASLAVAAWVRVLEFLQDVAMRASVLVSVPDFGRAHSVLEELRARAPVLKIGGESCSLREG